MKMKSNTLKNMVQKAVVAHADNNYLITEREEAEFNMNTMIKIYDNLQKASRGSAQEEKRKFFSCEWRWKSGYKIIENTLKEILVKNRKLEQ